MRVVFLDLDGVLNTREYVRLAGWAPPLGSERDLHILDPVAVERLNGVLEATAASVVITSSWRATYEEPSLRSLLVRRGFRGQIAGVTPQLPGRRRSAEIDLWLADHAVEAFAIVDDDPEAGAEHPSRFVQTTFEEGLVESHAEQLVRLLRSSTC